MTIAPYEQPERRDYTIVGAGAIGGTIAFALKLGGHTVTIIDTDAEHIAAVNAGGLRILRPDGHIEQVTVDGAYTPDDAPATPVGRVILATKSQHTAHAATWAGQRLTPDGFIVSAQNGHNEPVIAEQVGDHRVIGAFVNIFADYWAPGIIRDGGQGALVLGLPSGAAPDARVLETAEDLRTYGPVSVTRNLIGYRSAKAGFASVLATATLVDAPIAAVAQQYRDVAIAAAREQTELAIRSGIHLEAFDAYEPYAFSAAAPAAVTDQAFNRLIAWLRQQPKDRSGVFRDIAVRHRPIESGGGRTDATTRAAAVGVDLVIGPALHAALGQIAAGEATFGWHHLEQIRQLLPRG